MIAVSGAAMVAAAATLVLIWTASADMPLPKRINNSMEIGSILVLLGVAFLIAWRAGDHPPNVSIALAITFINSNGAFWMLLEELRANAAIRAPVDVLSFVLGAGFYIRASQLFPRKLTPDDIASTATMWGKIKPLRVVLIFFLRLPAVWVFVATVTFLAELIGNPDVGAANRLVIILTGLIYFYVMYRSGDVETGRKVLWFLEAALASLVIRFVASGVNTVLHGAGSPTARRSLGVHRCCELPCSGHLHFCGGVLCRRDQPRARHPQDRYLWRDGSLASLYLCDRRSVSR